MKHCSKCKQESRPNGRYCLECHAANMRKTRPKHRDLASEAKMKANCRAQANVYVKRGVIKRQSCEVCSDIAEKHHDDYTKPKQVRWFCRQHHLRLHE